MPRGGKVKIPVRQDPTLPAMPAAGSGRGGYYKDDGPGDNPPANLRDVPDAEVRNEPYSTRSNRPYVVFGKTYTPITDNQPFTQRGTGTWYGKKFHGQRTSSGEIYDMYKMTAAHPTLPIPSYARVTSIDSGEQVIVRINDRGPFHATRVIDVSYTAALKLGFLGKGSHQVIVERLLPADIDAILAARAAPKPVPSVVARSIDTPLESEPEMSSRGAAGNDQPGDGRRDRRGARANARWPPVFTCNWAPIRVLDNAEAGPRAAGAVCADAGQAGRGAGRRAVPFVRRPVHQPRRRGARGGQPAGVGRGQADRDRTLGFICSCAVPARRTAS